MDDFLFPFAGPGLPQYNQSPFHQASQHAGPFEQAYFCYSASSVDKPQLEKGDRVILPPSALQQLASSHTNYPMLFQLQNSATDFSAHCGVLEFAADEGTIYVPHWIMESLLLENGDIVRVKTVTLPKATFIKLQPHKQEFLKISDMKAVLETILQDFSCLTVGHSILLSYNNKEYYLEVVEAKPAAAVCMVDTDCEVEFARPLDATEPEKTLTDLTEATPGKIATAAVVSPPSPNTLPETTSSVLPSTNAPLSSQRSRPPTQSNFKPFTGVSRRLDGKPTASSLAVPNKPGVAIPKNTQTKPNPVSTKSSDSSFPNSLSNKTSGPSTTMAEQAVPKKTSDSSVSNALPKKASDPKVAMKEQAAPKITSDSCLTSTLPKMMSSAPAAKNSSDPSQSSEQITSIKSGGTAASNVQTNPKETLDGHMSAEQKAPNKASDACAATEQVTPQKPGGSISKNLSGASVSCAEGIANKTSGHGAAAAGSMASSVGLLGRLGRFKPKATFKNER